MPIAPTTLPPGMEIRCPHCNPNGRTRKATLERGASLPVVASVMGWSPSTTAKMAKRYGHIGNDVQRAALDALADARPTGDQSDAQGTNAETSDSDSTS